MRNWSTSSPFRMAHAPLKTTVEQAEGEVNHAWASSYSPEAIGKAVRSLRHKHVGERISILVARLCFRGTYFPQMAWRAWIKVVVQIGGRFLSLLEKRLALQDATA
jgi:hypothetical protein